MMKYLLTDIKKLYKSRLVQFMLLLLFIISVVEPIISRGRYEVLPNPYNWWLFMNNGIGSTIYNTIYWFIPAFFTGLVVFNEQTTSIYGIMLTKTTRSAYYASKAVSTFLVVLTNCLCFFLLNLLLVYLLCPTNEPIEMYLIPQEGTFAYPLFMDSPIKMAIGYNFLHALALALFTIFYISLHIGLKLRNKYIAIILPPLFMYATDYLLHITGNFQYSISILLQPMAASASTAILSTSSLLSVIGMLLITTVIFFGVGMKRNRDVL